MNKQCFDMLREAIEYHEYLTMDAPIFGWNRVYIEGYLHGCKVIKNFIDSITCEYEYNWRDLKRQIDEIIKAIQNNYPTLFEEHGVSFLYGYNELFVRVKNKDMPRIQGLLKDWNQE